MHATGKVDVLAKCARGLHLAKKMHATGKVDCSQAISSSASYPNGLIIWSHAASNAAAAAAVAATVAAAARRTRRRAARATSATARRLRLTAGTSKTSMLSHIMDPRASPMSGTRKTKRSPDNYQTTRAQ